MVLESSPDLWRMWQELLYASWFGDLMTDSFSLAAAQQKVSAEARAELTSTEIYVQHCRRRAVKS